MRKVGRRGGGEEGGGGGGERREGGEGVCEAAELQQEEADQREDKD